MGKARAGMVPGDCGGLSMSGEHPILDALLKERWFYFAVAYVFFRLGSLGWYTSKLRKEIDNLKERLSQMAEDRNRT